MKFRLIYAVCAMALMGTGVIVADVVTVLPADSYGTYLQSTGWSVPQKVYTISNTSYDYVYWQASAAAGLVNCQPSAGWIAPGASKTVTLSPMGSVSMAGPGTYYDNVTLDFDPRLPGDVTGDGKVNAFDMQQFSAAWNSHVGQPRYDPACDFNGDGAVNVLDLAVMSQNWGRTYGSTTL